MLVRRLNKGPHWNIHRDRVAPEWQWVWKGLRIAVPLNGNTQELFSGQMATLGGDPEWGVTNGGKSIVQPVAADYLEYPHYHGWDHLFDSDITLIWLGIISSTSSGFQSFGHLHAGNGTSNSAFEYRTESGGNSAEILRAGVSNSNWRSATTHTKGQFTMLSWSVPRLQEDTPAFYIDGVRDGDPSVQAAGTGGSTVGHTAPLRIGQRPDGATVSLDGGGHVSMFLAADRLWTDAEHAMFARDPFAAFRVNQPYIIGRPPGAPTGNGALDAGVSTLSGEGIGPAAVPSVDSWLPRAVMPSFEFVDKLILPTGVEFQDSPTGSGATLSAQDSSLSGQGVSSSVGEGDLSADAATLAGEGAEAIAAPGTLAAQAATMAGEGNVISIGNGALNAGASQLHGNRDPGAPAGGANPPAVYRRSNRLRARKRAA